MDYGEMKKLYKDRRLTHFVVSDHPKGCLSYASKRRGLTLKITLMNDLNKEFIRFEEELNPDACVSINDVDFISTKKLIKDEEQLNIKEIKKLWEEGRLTHFVLASDIKSTHVSAYKRRGETLEICMVDGNFVGWKGDKTTRVCVGMGKINTEATKKLIKDKEMDKVELKTGRLAEFRKGGKYQTLVGNKNIIVELREQL